MRFITLCALVELTGAAGCLTEADPEEQLSTTEEEVQGCVSHQYVSHWAEGTDVIGTLICGEYSVSCVSTYYNNGVSTAECVCSGPGYSWVDC